MDKVRHTTQLADHQERVQKLLQLAQQHLAILKALSLNTESRHVEALIQSLNTDEFRLLVIGEFSRGKSTLINAMLGKIVLPAYPTEATAIINEIRWGATTQAVIHSNENGIDKSESIPVEVLEKYVLVKEGQENPYSMVEIFWPLPLLEARVLIVDSPGLNVVSKARKAMTMNYLPQADAIIFVTFSQAAGDAVEIRTIEKIRDAGHSFIFFICNRINQIEPDERELVKRDARKKFGPYTDAGEKYIFFVNALGALKGREAMTAGKSQVTVDMLPMSPAQALKDSGIPEFESALTDFLVHERGRIKLLRPAIALQNLVHSAQNELNEREKLLKKQGDELAEQYKQKEGSLKHIERLRENIGFKIKSFSEDLGGIAKRASRELYRELPAKVDEWVADYELKYPVEAGDLWTQDARNQAAQRVMGELSEAMSEHIEAEFEQWEQSALQPLLMREGEELFPQVLQELREFAQEFEEVRRGLLDDDAGTNPVNNEQLEEFVRAILERITLMSGSVNLDEFGFGSLLKVLLPAGGVLGTIMLALSWHPFLFAIMLGITVVAVIFGQTGKINQKLKENFVQEYKAKLVQEGSDLSEQVGEAVQQRLQGLRENIDTALRDEVQKFRDQVEATMDDINQHQVEQRLSEIVGYRVELAKFDGYLSGMIGELKSMRANID